jgi:AcrR family transcriptional regulator
VNPSTHSVKRAYDARSRREAARVRRGIVLDHAAELMLRDGYAATTVASIARQAGVSTAMVYKTFGGKAGLVRALHARALEGEGPIPAESRSDSLRRTADPREIVAGWARLATEVAPRVAPVLLLVRDAAAADPEMREVAASFEAARHRRMVSNARVLAERGLLRTGVSRRHAADVMYALTSAELYELLVLRRRWSIRRFGDHVREQLTHALLDSG